MSLEPGRIKDNCQWLQHEMRAFAHQAQKCKTFNKKGKFLGIIEVQTQDLRN